MKKALSVLFLFISIYAGAQIHPDGTIINNFSATDINNNFFTSTTALNNGKHIIIDISATWCGICWSYHGTEVLNNYYKEYGPNGIQSQDAEVLFYEGDIATNSNDLNGVGTNTLGDWVTGSNYRIFNEATPSNVKSVFSANGILGYPSIFVVCSDKKMYRLATSINTVAAVRSFVNDKCGLNPLNAATVHSANYSYEIFPNPSSEDFSLRVDLDKKLDISYILYNTVGQQLVSKNLLGQSGSIKLMLQTADLPNGIYSLAIQIGDDHLVKKVLIQH